MLASGQIRKDGTMNEIPRITHLPKRHVSGWGYNVEKMQRCAKKFPKAGPVTGVFVVVLDTVVVQEVVEDEVLEVLEVRLVVLADTGVWRKHQDARFPFAFRNTTPGKGTLQEDRCQV